MARVKSASLRPDILALAIVLALPSSFAFAQDAEKTAKPTEPATLEAVTVTAERREEDIQDVPVSISAISGEKLDVLRSGGEDVKFLAGRLPSLQIESSFGRAFPRFYIRGLGNTDFDLNASQPVSLVYDDVVQENAILKGFPVFDLDQIELLRGPQGTQFGRNSPAGVVKFDSARPQSEFGGYGRISYGTFGTTNIEGAVTGALSDTVSARFSGLY
ncbi:MAG: TonB-dependent receptor, partial [Frankiaceae bacterium]|nr:TonB-dependent receptor [Arenimonas sp.]